MSDTIRLDGVTVDAPDALELARFYADVTVAAGATRLPFQPNADHCFVYADPVGHPFCLTTWSTRQLAEAAR